MEKKLKIGLIASGTTIAIVLVLVTLWAYGVFAGGTMRDGTYTFHNASFGRSTITNPTDIANLELPPEFNWALASFPSMAIGRYVIDGSYFHTYAGPTGQHRSSTMVHRLGRNNMIERHANNAWIPAGNTALRYFYRNGMLEIRFITNNQVFTMRFSR